MRSYAVERPSWPFGINRQNQQAAGLVAWYPVTPVGNSTWIDLVAGWNLSPTATRPSVANDEQLGQTWRFTAANATGFSRSGTTLLAGATAASISFWLWTTTVAGTGAPFVLYASNYNILIYRNASNIRAFINPNTNFGTTPGSSIAVNRWHHVAVVFNGGGADNAARLQIYINARAQSVTYSGTIPTALATGSQRVDAGVISGSTYPIDGYMADLRIYNRALLPLDVAGIWSPATRWQLYWKPRRRYYYTAPAEAAVTAAPVFYHHRRQQGMS